MKFIFGVLLLLILFPACRNDKYNPFPKIDLNPIVVQNCGDLTAVSFSLQAGPLIKKFCYECHDASTGFKLDNYNNILRFANSGQLSGCISGDQNYLQMPPTGPMDSCSIKTITN